MKEGLQFCSVSYLQRGCSGGASGKKQTNKQTNKQKPACQYRTLKREQILRSPRGGNGNPLQYSCLENSTDRGAWRAAVFGVARTGHN